MSEGLSEQPAAEGAAVTAENVLSQAGVFKGAEGLRGLYDDEDFWTRQPYGTRFYYGQGIAEYLHRSILGTAISSLESQAKELSALRSQVQALTADYDQLTDVAMEQRERYRAAESKLATAQQQLAATNEQLAAVTKERDEAKADAATARASELNIAKKGAAQLEDHAGLKEQIRKMAGALFDATNVFTWLGYSRMSKRMMDAMRR